MTLRFDVICLGEALVDMLPDRVGPLAQVSSFARHAGGAPANVAVGVARLGGRAAFIGTVGDDPFGAFLRTFLTGEGVNVDGVRVAQGQRTGVAFVSLDEHGKPSFLSAGRGGAELALDARDIVAFPVEDTWILHLGTYALSAEPAREAAFDAITRAKNSGAWIALDPNLRLHLWNDRAALECLVPKLVACADIVKLSSDEQAFVTGSSSPSEAARALVEAGPMLAVVTTGPDGCVYALRDASGIRQGSVPSRPARVVDTTGAGDGFMAALLQGAARLREIGQELTAPRLEKLLARCVESGARVCENVGAMAGLPTAADLAAFPLDE